MNVDLNKLWKKYKNLFNTEQYKRADKVHKKYKSYGGKRKRKKYYKHTAEEMRRASKKR